MLVADPSTDPTRMNRVYACWRRLNLDINGNFEPEYGGEAYFKYSDDGGQTFNPPQGDQLSYDDSWATLTAYVDAAVARDGRLYAIWYNDAYFYGDPPNILRPEGFEYRVISNAGTTFNPPLDQVPSYINFEALGFTFASVNGLTSAFTHFNIIKDQPSIAVDWSEEREGWVYVAFASERYWEGQPGGDNGGESDVYVVRSQDGGQNWDPPVKVNDDPQVWEPPPNNLPYDVHQFMPCLRTDTGGRVGVSWYDTRDHVEFGWNSTNYHIYFAYSIDGAATFEENFRVTCNQSDPFDPRGPGERVDIGDYSGMGAYGRWFVPVFTSLERYNPANPDHNRWSNLAGDIFTATVEVKQGPPDFDFDCDVDGEDFGTFQLCFGGSGVPPAPGCRKADLDGDNDVDLADFLILQNAYTGSHNQCAEAQGPTCGGEGESGPQAAPEGPGPVPGDPEPEEWYWMLYEYCRANNIPFS